VNASKPPITRPPHPSAVSPRAARSLDETNPIRRATIVTIALNGTTRSGVARLRRGETTNQTQFAAPQSSRSRSMARPVPGQLGRRTRPGAAGTRGRYSRGSLPAGFGIETGLPVGPRAARESDKWVKGHEDSLEPARASSGRIGPNRVGKGPSLDPRILKNSLAIDFEVRRK
jgi:hypothetical protein